MAGVENGQGSIGKLLKDDKLYNNLEGASKQLEQLLQDFKLNPKRYIHFSVFGKKPKQYDADGNEIKDKN
jgi:phospholipid/cholesterol/gamma-HCH transport system substrate-binding protein